MLSIAIAALGTRGDVQPLATLSWRIILQLSSQSVLVTLITHAAHQVWLEELLSSSGIQLLYVNSNPATVWQQQNSGSSSGNADTSSLAKNVKGHVLAGRLLESHSGNRGDDGASSKEAEIRQQLLQHCCAALCCQWPPCAHQAAKDEEHQTQQLRGEQAEQPNQQQQWQGIPRQHHDEHQQQQQQQEQQWRQGQRSPQQQQQQQRLLIFNLFALECYHIAEGLQVPCMVAQPYLIPYGMPSGFQRRFSRALPDLAQKLQRNIGQQGVSWADVSHWMWPLFTERWGPWRQELLHLHALPLVQAVQEGWQGCTYSRPGSRSSSSRSCSSAAGVWQLPASVPVLYGLSAQVVMRPGYWPHSVQLTGFWLLSDLHQQPAWQQQQQQQLNKQQQRQFSDLQSGRQPQHKQMGCCKLADSLQSFLTGCKSLHSQHSQNSQHHTNSLTKFSSSALVPNNPAAGHSRHFCCAVDRGILLVDFGSMGCLGLLRDAQLLLQVLLEALKLLNWCGVLMTGGWQPLAHAHAALNPEITQQLHLQEDSVGCHHLLLSQVDVVLHHGGSGTTAAAVAAGVPQLICPMQFDQFYWADCIAHLGCSPGNSLSLDRLLPPVCSSSNNTGQPAAAAEHKQQQPSNAAASRQQRQQEVMSCIEQQQPATAAAMGMCKPEQDCLPRQAAAPTERAAAVAAAASYLASQVLAARQANVVAACASMKEELAHDNGLQTAAASVLQHCQELFDAISSP